MIYSNADMKDKKIESLMQMIHYVLTKRYQKGNITEIYITIIDFWTQGKKCNKLYYLLKREKEK